MIEVNGWARVSQDVVVKNVGNTKVAEISVATNEIVGKEPNKKEITSFFDLEVWDTAADYAEKNVRKGDMISFRGIPRQEKWTDKETGKTRSKVIFRVTKFFNSPKAEKAE